MRATARCGRSITLLPFAVLPVQGHLHSVRELLAAGADTTLKVRIDRFVTVLC